MLYQLLTIAGITVYLFLMTVSIVALVRCFRKINQPMLKTIRDYPGVSILKPLRGGGLRLQHNLKSFFHLNYPKFELLFAIEDSKDPAYAIVTALINTYPHVDAKILISYDSKIDCVNPKIRNLLPAYKAAKYELLLISDDTVRVDSDTVVHLVNEHLQEDGIGIVWQLPLISTQISRTMGAAINQVYFAACISKGLFTWAPFEPAAMSGSNFIIKRAALEECGGLGAFGKYLAEDSFISANTYKQGYKLRMSSRPAYLNPPVHPVLTVKHLMDRFLRWKLLRCTMMPFIEMVYPFQDHFILGIIGALSISGIWPKMFWIFFLLHLVLSCSIDFARGRRTVRFRQLLLSWLFLLFAIPMAHLFGILNCSRTVTWRGNKYRLKRGGECLPVTQTAQRLINI